MTTNIAPLSRPRLWRFLAVVMLAVVVTLSLVPDPPQPPGLLSWDKLQHTTAYAFLAWWFLQSWEGRRPFFWCVFLVAVGCGIEGLQALTAVRQPSILDAIANLLGVAMGGLIWRGPLGGVLSRLDALTWTQA